LRHGALVTLLRELQLKPGNSNLKETSGPQWAEMLLVGAACSQSYTGFVFGVDNYAYDLPMVAWLFDEPPVG
jgi:hypothetical protein